MSYAQPTAKGHIRVKQNVFQYSKKKKKMLQQWSVSVLRVFSYLSLNYFEKAVLGSMFYFREVPKTGGPLNFNPQYPTAGSDHVHMAPLTVSWVINCTAAY